MSTIRTVRTVRTSLSTLFLAVLFAAPFDVGAQTGAPMQHEVYERWDTIGGETLSRDGRWVLYNRLRYDRDDVLVVRSTVDMADTSSAGRSAESNQESSAAALASLGESSPRTRGPALSLSMRS